MERAMLMGLASVAVALVAYIIVYRTLSRCRHRWQTAERMRLTSVSAFGNAQGTRYILRCAHCGAISKKDVL